MNEKRAAWNAANIPENRFAVSGIASIDICETNVTALKNHDYAC